MANNLPRVLVVDDDEGVLALEVRALERAGYPCLRAVSAEQALDALGQCAPDLMVTDYRLGGALNGIEMYRQFRDLGYDLPTLLVTGFSDETRVLEALRAGFRDVVPKTAGFLEYLPEAVARIARQVGAERALHEASRLRESERRFRQLADAMPQLVWTARSDGTVDYINQRYREFSGLIPDERGGWGWLAALHPDDVQRTVAAWQHAVATGSVYEIEHRVRRHDGEYRWFVNRGVPARDGTGRITAWYGTATDIDALKQAQEAARQNEERLRLAIESARMFAFEWDRRTDVVVRSSECLDILGPDAGVQETFAQFQQRLHPDDRERLRRTIDSLTPASPRYHTTYRLFRTDGKLMYAESTARATFDESGKPVRLIGMTADITARRDVERRLSETTAILRAVADTTPDLIFVKDRGSRMLFLNPSMLAAIGKPPAKVLGLSDLEWHDDRSEAEAIVASDQRVLTSGTTESVEERLTGPAGTRTYLTTKSPLRGEAGDVVGIVCIASDITDRARADQERRQLLAREQLARAEAERANVLKDQFLATLSHELRTPLNAILGWAQILSTRRIEDGERVREILATIARNAQVQVRLIEDLLDMSRILSGKMRLDLQPVHLPGIVQAAVDSIRPAADAKRLRVRFLADPAAGSPAVGDPERLQQIAWNLLSNAVKFTPSGGAIDVVLDVDDDRLRLTVTDTGPGIPSEFLPYVFDRFRQADASATRAHGGLGLGLSIAKHLVELHGGTIAADNAPGAGARFTVLLPVAPGDEELSELLASEAPPTGSTDLHGVRVLAVDDEPDARELVQRILEDHGATVAAVHSVDAALDHFNREPFDAMVVDIAMPERDGYELVRAVRAHPDAGRRGVAAVALTAFARAEDQTRALRAGFNHYASKPIMPEQLAAIVASAIAATKERR